MKKFFILIILLFTIISGFSQKILLIEKIGTSQKFYFHEGKYFKILKKSTDSIIKGHLWSIGQNSLTIYNGRFLDVPVSDIRIVYKRYDFLLASAFTFVQASVYFFVIIAFNHMINHEQVMTPDVWIISGACLAAATICFSFSEKRCRIGDRWKIKILDINIKK